MVIPVLAFLGPIFLEFPSQGKMRGLYAKYRHAPSIHICIFSSPEIFRAQDDSPQRAANLRSYFPLRISCLAEGY